LVRWAAILAIAALTAACFQPLYGERSPGEPGPTVRTALAAVDVEQIDAPNGTPDSRVAVELRNKVLFHLTGGAGSIAPTHRLRMKMNTSKSAIIVDIATGRTEAEIVSIDVSFTLTEIATKRVVVNGSTFARVSADIPGEQQRFAHARAQREGEDRAAGVIAEQIRLRLASHFVAGT
jgi:LPS-assembly lipoprotein